MTVISGQGADRGHVVMAVPTSIERDARVRKTAISVKNLGFRVTLLWTGSGLKRRTEGEFEGVRTIGLPLLRSVAKPSRQRSGNRRRTLRQRVGLAYCSEAAVEAGAVTIAARQARIPVESAKGLRRARWLHQVRSRGFEAVPPEPDEASEDEIERPCRGRGRWNWRRELTWVGNLEVAFGPEMAKLEPDILHIHDWPLLWIAANTKRLLSNAGKRVALVYDAHEYVTGQYIPSVFFHRAAILLEKEAMEHIDAVITVSDLIAERLAEDFHLDQPPTVVLNVPALTWGQVDSPRDLRSEAGVGTDVPLVLYSGGLMQARNVGRVVEALARLPRVHLAVICVPHSGTPGALDLVEAAEELGVADRLHLLEPVPPEEIVSFIAGATMGIHPMLGGFPNHEMAMPNKIFDYFRAGLPVAVSNLPAMSRVVSEWEAGETFDPLDVASMAAAIERVLANRDALAAGLRNPELLKKYSWERQVEELGNLYDRLDGQIRLPNRPISTPIGDMP